MQATPAATVDEVVASWTADVVSRVNRREGSEEGAIRRDRRKIATFCDCSSGAAILEFAIILPVLVAILAGTVEIGRALLDQLVMQEAVRAGARYLARVPNPTCLPACSEGAAHAVQLVRSQIFENTSISPSDLQVAPVPVPPMGTVAIRAEARLTLEMLSAIGLPVSWTVTVWHQEQRVGE